jgi:hypothetical protein
MTGHLGYAARRAVWVGKMVATWAFVVAVMALAANVVTRL